MAKNLYPSLDSTMLCRDGQLSRDNRPSLMLCANVEWKGDKINIGKELGIDGIKVTSFHLRFGLKISYIIALKMFFKNSYLI